MQLGYGQPGKFLAKYQDSTMHLIDLLNDYEHRVSETKERSKQPTDRLANAIHRLITAIIACFIGSVLLTGCAATSTPTHFYILNPITTPRPTNPITKQSPTLGIGPVSIPKYLDRPEIVSRQGPNRLKIDEFHQWAGPLKDNIQFTIAENLSRLIPNNGMALYPWKKSDGVTLRISITIQRFEIDGSKAVLIANWTEGRGDQLATLSNHRSEINIPVTADNYPAKIAAMNLALDTFGKEIAATTR